MKLLGTLSKGDQIFEVGANTKRVSRYLVLQTARLSKLTLYCDGLGSGLGPQVLRGVVYNATGDLIGQGIEVVIADGQQPGWVDLPFPNPYGGVPLVAGQRIDIGYLAGQSDKSARVYGRISVGV